MRCLSGVNVLTVSYEQLCEIHDESLEIFKKIETHAQDHVQHEKDPDDKFACICTNIKFIEE